jgi:hypothetical protein
MEQKDFNIDKIFFVEVKSESPVLTHPEVISVFKVFMTNMHSVFSLGATVPMFVAFTSLYQEVEFKALHNLGLDPDSERTMEVKTEAYRLLCEATKSPNHKANMHEWGLRNLKTLMRFYPAQFDEGIESVLWAMVTGSWTAFEILCEDLFKCAERARPSHFAAINFKNPGFRSRKKIRDTYAAFFKNDTAIEKALQDPLLDALALFRNVKVHKAGIADGDFINGIAAIDVVTPPKRGLKDGDKIEIEGGIVRALIAAAIKPGETLAKSVDDWIAHHP